MEPTGASTGRPQKEDTLVVSHESFDRPRIIPAKGDSNNRGKFRSENSDRGPPGSRGIDYPQSGSARPGLCRRLPPGRLGRGSLSEPCALLGLGVLTLKLRTACFLAP